MSELDQLHSHSSKSRSNLNVQCVEKRFAGRKVLSQGQMDALEDLNSTTADINGQSTNDDLQAKYDALEDRFLRNEAEMANMTKRFKKEQEQLLKYEGQDLAKSILPALDNLDRALASQVEDEASAQLKKGVQMVLTGLQDALSANSITKIEALGQPFDPNLHQAVQSVPATDGQKADTVVQVFQDGYKLKDRVLRPAMVVVAQ